MRQLLFLLVFSLSTLAAAGTHLVQSLPSLPTVGHEPVKLDPKAKGYVLVFMAGKCPCSNSHISEIKELSQNFKDFQFFGIHSSQDESMASTEAYFKKANLPFPLIQDEQAKIADELKAYKTPHAFVISTEGEILYQGGLTNSAQAPKATQHYLKEALEDLKAGRPVKVANGRTLGCVITREKGSYVW